MQKPTIERIEIRTKDTDGCMVYFQVIDTKGEKNNYYWNKRAEYFYEEELAKWEADQNPQVLFDSETVKVMKFKDEEQFRQYIYETNDNHHYRGNFTNYIYNQPILFIADNSNNWHAINNLTDQLVADLRKVADNGKRN